MIDNNKTSDMKNNKVVQAIAFAVAFVIAFILIRVVLNRNDNNSESETVSTEQQAEPYTSKPDNFTANFGGYPTFKSQNLDVGGKPVNVVYYENSTDDGNKITSLSVANYSAREFDFTADAKQRKALEDAVAGAAKKSGSEVVSTDNEEKFLGNNAIRAELLAKKDGKEAKIYSLYFLKEVPKSEESTANAVMYTLTTINQDKAVFDKFVDSFKLN